jgi:hypothetical protein
VSHGRYNGSPRPYLWLSIFANHLSFCQNFCTSNFGCVSYSDSVDIVNVSVTVDRIWICNQICWILTITIDNCNSFTSSYTLLFTVMCTISSQSSLGAACQWCLYFAVQQLLSSLAGFFLTHSQSCVTTNGQSASLS